MTSINFASQVNQQRVTRFCYSPRGANEQFFHYIIISYPQVTSNSLANCNQDLVGRFRSRGPSKACSGRSKTTFINLIENLRHTWETSHGSYQIDESNSLALYNHHLPRRDSGRNQEDSDIFDWGRRRWGSGCTLLGLLLVFFFSFVGYPLCPACRDVCRFHYHFATSPLSWCRL